MLPHREVNAYRVKPVVKRQATAGDSRRWQYPSVSRMHAVCVSDPAPLCARTARCRSTAARIHLQGVYMRRTGPAVTDITGPRSEEPFPGFSTGLRENHGNLCHILQLCHCLGVTGRDNAELLLILHSYWVMAFTTSGNHGFTRSCYKGNAAAVSCKRKLAEVTLAPCKHHLLSAFCPAELPCVVWAHGPAAAFMQLTFSWGKSLGSARAALRALSPALRSGNGRPQRARSPAGGSKALRESGEEPRSWGSLGGLLASLGRAPRLAAAAVLRRGVSRRSEAPRRGSVAAHWGRREVAAPPASTASRRSRARGTACGRRR